MTKFEEEFDKNIDVFHVIGCHNGMCCSVKEVKVFGKDWVSPEDHQAEIAKLNSKIDWLHGLLDERNEEVLQTVKLLNEAQPEIPEVPEFVGEWLDRKPLYAINGSIPVEIIEWSQKQTGYADLGMNISHLLKLKVNGYTVAKEKRFYLKNKLTGLNLVEEKTFSLTGKHVGERFREFEMQYIPTDEQEARLYKNTFTQQEIDSMAAESYEQIEVEE